MSSPILQSEAVRMPVARKNVVDLENPGTYHCISRCVRRMFLCRGDIGDRKQWLHNRLIDLSMFFCIEVSAHAFLDNHFHVLLHTHPERAAELDAESVIWRWFMVYPKSIHRWAKSRGMPLRGVSFAFCFRTIDRIRHKGMPRLPVCSLRHTRVGWGE